MENRFDTAPEPRKEWVAPELKKIDVEEITASGGTTFNSDGGGSFS
jgi:hypothetical protein